MIYLPWRKSIEDVPPMKNHTDHAFHINKCCDMPPMKKRSGELPLRKSTDDVSYIKRVLMKYLL